ncbi:MAG: hypothetical protein DRQ89_14430 [Epsilonproteobacteria bacterium]|nr:MAG: hypothetical protein DRQ89_14430 [Campylobacterota bacterium]
MSGQTWQERVTSTWESARTDFIEEDERRLKDFAEHFRVPMDAVEGLCAWFYHEGYRYGLYEGGDQ